LNSMSRSRQVLVIDAIDSGIARLEGEDSRTWEVPAGWLPEGVRAGDCLVLAVDTEREKAILTLVIDREATDAARTRVRSKLDRLRGGDQ
jgi:hypothetical protein